MLFEKDIDAKLLFYAFVKTGNKSLDSNKYVAAVLMDLPKAFNWLPHNIHVLLSKLSAYGLSENSVLLLKSYLWVRKQQIKSVAL